jgi:A/G-specific adenine glycosylase
LEHKKYFTKKLLEWYSPTDRPMPWKEEKNPYLIWLSEIMLQQTRVEQGLSYYIKFKKNYPTVADLANAPEDELMKHWEGLGYYSRARNLHTSAKFIHNELNGVFPDTYQDIISLKGVGEYTAAAIASFAYSLPHAVVDGNVYRVLSRFFGIDIPTDSTEGKKYIKKIADEVLHQKDPARYNQAIMDFGATVCKPKLALCDTCPMKRKCIAYKYDRVGELPIKTKKIKKITRYFIYLVINKGTSVFIRKRTEKDIWKNLYEYPMIETKKELNEKDLLKQKDFLEIFFNKFYGISKVSDSYVQQLTHRSIIAKFVEINVSDDFKVTKNDWLCVEKTEIRRFAFPKIIDLYLT